MVIIGARIVAGETTIKPIATCKSTVHACESLCMLWLVREVVSAQKRREIGVLLRKPLQSELLENL